MSLLETTGARNKRYFTSMMATANREPPATNDPAALGNFYFERGKAAKLLGMSSQQLADLRRARAYADKSNKLPKSDIYLELSRAESRMGNFSAGIALRKEVIGITARKGLKAAQYAALGWVYALAGDVKAAREAIGKAEGYLSQIHGRLKGWKKAFTESIVLTAKADMLTALGRLREAEVLYRKAIVIWDPYENARIERHARNFALVYHSEIVEKLAQNLKHQGRLVEAEIEARKAILAVITAIGRITTYSADKLATLASILLEQERYEAAAAIARAGLDVFEEAGVAEEALDLSLARSYLADALVGQGRWREALAQYETMREAMRGDEYTFRSFLQGNVNWALAYLRTGEPNRALEILEPAHERNLELLGLKHYRTAEIGGFLAMAFAARSERARALEEFERAIPILLTRSRAAEAAGSSRAAKDQRLKLILEAYMALLADIAGTEMEETLDFDPVAEAFRIADAARARGVQRALAASSARAAARDPALAELARREQDAQHRIAALYGLLSDVMTRAPEDRDPKAIESLRVQIDELRDERGALAGQIAQQFPEYSDLVNPTPATLDQAQAALGDGEALIATYAGEDRIFVWAVPRKGEASFFATDAKALDLAFAVAVLRGSLEPSGATLGDIPEFDLETAYGLYRALLEPAADTWRSASTLIVVPDGPLGFLPLSLLPTERPGETADDGGLFSGYRSVAWLARSHAVAVLPSVSSLLTLRSGSRREAGTLPFVGFGDPYFSPEQAAQAKAQLVAAVDSTQLRGMPLNLRGLLGEVDVDSAELALLPRLPDTAEEVRRLAIAMKADLGEDIFLGIAANEENVKAKDLARYRVIAFATHGLLPGDLNGLTQPALALTAPAVAGVSGDGLITLSEILELRLNAEWVILSACNTASGDGAGAEAVSGLGRAFFYAGTRALMASNWPVHSAAATQLTTDLFRRWTAETTLDKAEALRRAMIDMIDGPGYKHPRTGKPLFSYAHPLFWAPFSLIGSPS